MRANPFAFSVQIQYGLCVGARSAGVTLRPAQFHIANPRAAFYAFGANVFIAFATCPRMVLLHLKKCIHTPRKVPEEAALHKLQTFSHVCVKFLI